VLLRPALLIIATVAGVLTPVTVASGQETPPASEGSIGIRLAEAPVDRRDDPRARAYIVDHVQPGTTISRRVEVANNSDRALEPVLYATPALVQDGGFVGADRGATSELTGWTNIEPEQLTLAPRERVVATVTIRVPADASGGERYGAVWAELSGDPDAGDVTVVNRVGVRIYLSVGGPEEPPSDFTIDSLTARRLEDGSPQVTAKVTNTGQRALDMSGELTLEDGPGGLRAGPFPAELGTTLGIGDTEDVTVNLDPEIPDGPWQARLTLTSGITERTAEATIMFPEEAGTAAEPVEAKELTDTISGLILLAIALFLLLLVLGLLAWFIWSRRRRSADRDDVSPT
jgi:hypothetical protein